MRVWTQFDIDYRTEDEAKSYLFKQALVPVPDRAIEHLRKQCKQPEWAGVHTKGTWEWHPYEEGFLMIDLGV